MLLNETTSEITGETIISSSPEATMPIWLGILVSLASGLIAAIVTIIIQFVAEKKKVKRDLFLELVSLRNCPFDDERFRLAMNKVQIVFYKHNEVIKAYEELLFSLANTTFNPSKTMMDVDKFIVLLEKMACVTRYNKFNWEMIKKKYSPPDLYNDEIVSSENSAVMNNGLAKKKNQNNDSSSTTKGGIE